MPLNSNYQILNIMIRHKILFVCVHNSGRSKMAEGFLNKYGGEYFEAESAALEPGELNPNAVAMTKEEGIEITKNETMDVFDLFKEGRLYQAVITLCDEAKAELCPTFPGVVRRLTWSFPDPSAFKGTQDEILEQTRKVRDGIKDKVQAFIEEAKEPEYWAK